MARFAVAALLFCVPTIAQAHHPSSENDVGDGQPSSRLELELQAAAYALGDRTGTWQLVAPSFELGFHRRLSVAVRMPIAHIDDAQLGSRVGVADWEISAKSLVVADQSSGFSLTAGLGVELPTGAVDDGLGSGHLELSPFVSSGMDLAERLSATAMVTGRFSLGEEHEHAAPARPIYGPAPHVHDDGAVHPHEAATGQSMLNPHARHELAVRLGVTYDFGLVYAGLGSEVTLQLSEPDPWGPVVGRGDVGVRFDETRISAGLDVPFAGDKRYDYRVRLGIAWFPQ